MKIIHIATNAPYNEGWGYQENLLTKYQAKLGHEVTLIVTNLSHLNNELVEVQCEDYFSEDGFRVIRKHQIKSKLPKLGNLLIKFDVYDILVETMPDFIFYHGLVSTTIFQVTKYKRQINPNCVIVQDNHFDYNIGFNPHESVKNRVKGYIWKLVYKLNDKYISRVYGVTPWRKDYAIDVFGVPREKADVLIMGADDDYLNFSQRVEIKREIRTTNQISESDFLIVTGGKLDKKKEILTLMQAVNRLVNVKLLIFGEPSDEIKVQFSALLSERIIWLGWIDSNKVYDYFFSADLAVFLGQHSVLWEQACASKIPCLFSRWPGMQHVDNGGNSDFIDSVTMESVIEKLNELIFTDKYYNMLEIAQSDKTDIYLYSNIAKKSLECIQC